MYGYKNAQKEVKPVTNQFWADVVQALADFIELHSEIRGDPRYCRHRKDQPMG